MKPKRLALFALLLLLSVAGPAWAEDIYVSGSNPLPGDGSPGNPFQTITQALNKARVDRGIKQEPIIILVAPGNYFGTYTRPVPRKLEALPLLLDIPNLLLRGATTLTLDSQGVPSGIVKGTSTSLRASPALSDSNQFLLLIGPTSSTGLPVSRVTVAALILDGGSAAPELDGAGVGVDRAQGFEILGNVMRGAFFGVVARASTGVIGENLMTPLTIGSNLEGGNQTSRASYVFTQNSAVRNSLGGVILFGDGQLNRWDPNLLEIPSGTTFDTSFASVSGNDLSQNSDPHISFGMRCSQHVFSPDLAATPTSQLTLSVTGNRISKNSFGIIVDAGPIFRFFGHPFESTLEGTFQNNNIDQNTRSPALITFTDISAALAQKKKLSPEVLTLQYLQNSTFRLLDSDGELNGFWFDNPSTDPLDGRTLNNILTINGVLILGRNIP
jgi:hypothetical protein